jgi:hypothetical protein
MRLHPQPRSTTEKKPMTRETINIPEGMREWIVAYIAKDPQGTLCIKFRDFSQKEDADTFAKNQKAGCASLWRKISGLRAEKIWPLEGNNT